MGDLIANLKQEAIYLGRTEKLLDEKASIDALYGASSDKEAKELNCVIPKQPDTAGLF